MGLMRRGPRALRRDRRGRALGRDRRRPPGRVEPGPPPALDPERHYLEGSREDVAALPADPRRDQLRLGLVPDAAQAARAARATTRSPGRWPTASAPRARGPNEELRAHDADEIARDARPGPRPRADGRCTPQALRQLGRFLGRPRARSTSIDAAGGSAERLAEQLAAGMPFFDDTGFYKRAQITPNDLALAGVAEFDDLDRLTIFADNLVPTSCACDGVLRYDPELAADRRSGCSRPASRSARSARARCTPASRSPPLGVPPRTLDVWLWNRGQDPRYKARPRHRTRTVFY